MFEYVKGTIVEKAPTYTVLDTQGVAYRLITPLSVYNQLPQLYEETLLYTQLITKEEGQYLYGFINKEDRARFNALITISKVGPKLALLIVGNLDYSVFYQAVQSGDSSLFFKIPGIGKKTAERLILEMKDKIKNLPPSLDSSTSMITDSINALINLGYDVNKAQKAVQFAVENDKPTDLSDIITQALKSPFLQK